MHALKLLLDNASTLRPLETLHDNIFWPGAAPRISVCVPAYNQDVSPLIEALSGCQSAGLVEMIVLDDGSRNHDLLARMEATAGRARLAIRIVAAHDHRGQAAARGAAVAHARADWSLFLDAHMQPDTPQFVETYLDAVDRTDAPALIMGGYSLRAAPLDRAYALHRWQARTDACLPARVRSRSPGQHAFSSNVLVHRTVLERCPFDEGSPARGWEDTDWGLRAQRLFPLVHIDNTATPTDLDSTDMLMGRYACSAANFARLLERHPEDTATLPVFRTATRARALPFRQSFKRLAADLARSESLPIAVRGYALKAWRALVHAESL